ncbi:MAG TPA: hypothetical protein EYP98_07085, partial [Planctomycetes bacterium]|nr:hypothetical protein [Planctomycetota bacterium]
QQGRQQDRQGRQQDRQRRQQDQQGRQQDRQGRQQQGDRQGRQQDRQGRQQKQERDRQGRQQLRPREDDEFDDRGGRSRRDPLAERSTPVARFKEAWPCLLKCYANGGPRHAFRTFARQPEPMAPVVCLFCDDGNFLCEEDFVEHVKERHGGLQHYRSNAFALYANMPPFVGGQIQRSVVRNFSEFLARGALGWKNFDDSMKEAVHSEEGLKSEQRWAPRAWVACVVCALQDWGETRVPVRIGGMPCREDCPEGCSAHCFFRNPKAVAELLDPERYVDDEHWSWLPKEEVRRSCPKVVLCIDGVRQRRRLLLHRRRLQDDEACTGQRAVPVCRLCYTALAATKPRMPLHALANGLWLGRHP